MTMMTLAILLLHDCYFTAEELSQPRTSTIISCPGGTPGGAGAAGAPLGQAGPLAVDPGGRGYGSVLGGTGATWAQREGSATVALWPVPEPPAPNSARRVGSQWVRGGARLRGLYGRRRWRRRRLRTGRRAPGSARGLGYAPGGAGANGAPSVALGHVAHDGPGGPKVGSDIYGNGSAGNPFTAWADRSTRL